MVRKGMGSGTGKGYKNIVGRDPAVHSQSAQGIKQPQAVNVIIPKNKVEYSSEEQAIIDEMGKDNLEQIKKDYGDITEFKEQDGHYFLEAGGMEFLVFESDDEAENYAKERVREDLENEPEMFSKDWLENHIYITDTDRRIMAGEESDNRIDSLSDEEIIKSLNVEDEYDQITLKIANIENSVENYSKMPKSKLDKIAKLNKERDNFIDKSKEKLRGNIYDEMYEGMKDPIQHFVDNEGIYTREDLLKQSFISINIDEANDDAVATDGWQHFIATYDGNSIDLKDGWVMARTN